MDLKSSLRWEVTPTIFRITVLRRLFPIMVPNFMDYKPLKFCVLKFRTEFGSRTLGPIFLFFGPEIWEPHWVLNFRTPVFPVLGFRIQLSVLKFRTQFWVPHFFGTHAIFKIMCFFLLYAYFSYKLQQTYV